MILDLLLDRLNTLTGNKKPYRQAIVPARENDLPVKLTCSRCRYYAGAGLEDALKCAVNPIGDASTCEHYELRDI